MTLVQFEKGKNTILLVYANSSKRIIWTGASTSMWMHKPFSEVASWLLGAGWKQENTNGKNSLRIMQSLFAPQLQKESETEV